MTGCAPSSPAGKMSRDWSEWVPLRVRRASAGPQVEWLHCGTRRFREPFFEDSVKRLGGALRTVTGIEELEEWAASRPGMAPTGFVFHMSRCGSTLISQMLAAVKGNRVISEAPALDDVLRLGVRQDADVARWLRAVMSALGQPAAEERRLFVKWDC